MLWPNRFVKISKIDRARGRQNKDSFLAYFGTLDREGSLNNIGIIILDRPLISTRASQ
jgi:hypothetical protein